MESSSSLPEFVKPRTKIGDYLRIYVTGFAMGSADVVPGVSGGTVAFVMGIYEELIGSIRMVGRSAFWRPLLRLQWQEAFRQVNLYFLLALGAGVLSAIFLLAPGIEWLLVHQPVLIWSFFCGLIVASILVVAPRVTVWSGSRWLGLLLGAVFGYWLVGLVPVQTPETWWFLMLTGAIAICAMILPGISGSFIMVLMGKYHYFINAINERDFASLAFAALGAMIGLVTFAQVLSWLFRRFHDVTIAALTGLMLGTLPEVWPWKELIEQAVDPVGEVAPLIERNYLPSLMLDNAFNMEILAALTMAVLGMVIVFVLERIANGRSQNEQPASISSASASADRAL